MMPHHPTLYSYSVCQFLCDCISFLLGLPCFSSRFLSTTIPRIIYQQNDTLLCSLPYILYSSIPHTQYSLFCGGGRTRMHRITYTTHTRTHKDRHNFIFYVSCCWIFSFYFTKKKPFKILEYYIQIFREKLIFYHRCGAVR